MKFNEHVEMGRLDQWLTPLVGAYKMTECPKFKNNSSEFSSSILELVFLQFFFCIVFPPFPHLFFFLAAFNTYSLSSSYHSFSYRNWYLFSTDSSHHNHVLQSYSEQRVIYTVQRATLYAHPLILLGRHLQFDNSTFISSPSHLFIVISNIEHYNLQ